MHRLGMHACMHATTHTHTHTHFNYCMHYVYKQNQAVFTLIHFTNTATFAVYIFQMFTLIHAAAVFSLRFFICFNKYPLWYLFSF